MLLYGYPPSNGSASGENGSVGKKSKGDKGFRFPGILKFLERNFEESNSDSYREWITQYMSATLCATCHGKRLRPESLAVKLASWSIADFTALSLSSARPAVDKILQHLTERQKEIAARPARRSFRTDRFSSRRGPRLSQLGSLGRHSLRRRSSAHPPGHANRFAAARRPLCP